MGIAYLLNMSKPTLNCVLILLLFNQLFFCGTEIQIQFSEFGENVSYVYNGVIPAFKPHYEIKLEVTDPALKTSFTYVRVAYYNLLSQVNINFYRKPSNIVSFHIKYPFVDTPIGIIGYSLPSYLIITEKNVTEEEIAPPDDSLD